MSEILDIRDEIMAISVLPETAVNTPYLNGTDFTKILTEPMPLQEPQWNKTPDSKNVGDGSRHTRKTKRKYLKQRNYPVTHDLNTHVSNILAVRAMGGAVADSAIASNTGCFEHNVVMGSGTGVKGTTFIQKIGSLGFVNWSLGVNSFSIKQQGADTPTVSFDTITPGGFHHIHSFDDNVMQIPVGLDLSTMVAAPEYFTYDGAKTKLTFSDGTTTYSFTAGDQRLLNLEVMISQNIVIKPMPGDLQLHPTKLKYGFVPNRMYHQTHTVKINFDLFLTDSNADFNQAMAKNQLSSLKVTFEGDLMTPSGTAFYTFEVNIPKFEFGELGSATDDTFGTISRTVQSPDDIFGDPATGGLATLRIRDKVAVLR